MPSVTASRGNGRSVPAAVPGWKPPLCKLSFSWLAAPRGRWSGREMGQKSIQNGSFSRIFTNPIVLSPPSGWVSTRSLCLPAQVAEQCLLFSQVFTPDSFWVFGFWFCAALRKSAPLAGVLLVPSLGRAGQGWLSLLLVPLPLHFKTVQSRRDSFTGVHLQWSEWMARNVQNRVTPDGFITGNHCLCIRRSQRQ